MNPMTVDGERLAHGQALKRLITTLGLVAVLTVFMLVPLTGAMAADESPIGSVKSVEGAAFVVSKGARNPAKLGLRVYQNDVLVTEDDGAIGVTFNDDTMISIGPKSELTIDEYVFNGD